MDKDVTLLPLPDSPTRQSVFPFSIVKEMLSVALTNPFSVMNPVVRFSTSSNLSAIVSASSGITLLFV
ncbi:hypothetical protein D3C86_1862290 [compost metagenome]